MEPVTTQLQQGMSREEVEQLISRAVVNNNALENARKRQTKVPGLLKGLMEGSQQADRDMQLGQAWLQAMAEGDVQYLKTAQKQYVTDLIDGYNSGTISRHEFKSLAPVGDDADLVLKTLSPANEGTNSAGGYNIPTPLATEIMRNLGDFSLARKLYRPFAMTSVTQGISGILTKPSVAVYGENTQIAATKPVWDKLTLTAKKIACIYPATNEYLDDANIDAVANMVELVGEQLGIAETQNAFQNANTNWNGLLWYGAGTITSGVAANGAYAVYRSGASNGGKTGYPQIGDTIGSTDLWSDMARMLTAIPNPYFKDAVFLVDQNILVAALALRTSQGQFVSNFISQLNVQTGLNGEVDLYYMGYKVIPVPSTMMLTYDASAHADTPFLVFCNPTRAWAVMGQRGGFTMDVSISATADSRSAFEYDLKLFRFKERVAFGVGRPDSVIVLRTDAT